MLFRRWNLLLWRCNAFQKWNLEMVGHGSHFMTKDGWRVGTVIIKVPTCYVIWCDTVTNCRQTALISPIRIRWVIKISARKKYLVLKLCLIKEAKVTHRLVVLIIIKKTKIVRENTTFLDSNTMISPNFPPDFMSLWKTCFPCCNKTLTIIFYREY